MRTIYKLIIIVCVFFYSFSVLADEVSYDVEKVDLVEDVENKVEDLFTYVKEGIYDENGELIGYSIYKKFSDGTREFVKDVFGVIGEEVVNTAEDIKDIVDIVSGTVDDVKNIFKPTNKEAIDNYNKGSMIVNSSKVVSDMIPGGQSVPRSSKYLLNIRSYYDEETGAFAPQFYSRRLYTFKDLVIQETDDGWIEYTMYDCEYFIQEGSGSISSGYDDKITVFDDHGETGSGVRGYRCVENIYVNDYDSVSNAILNGKFSDDTVKDLVDGYSGYGDPSKGVKPTDDIFNPDNPEYNEQFANDVMQGIYNINARFKVDFSDWWAEWDKRGYHDWLSHFLLPDNKDSGKDDNKDSDKDDNKDSDEDDNKDSGKDDNKDSDKDDNKDSDKDDNKDIGEYGENVFNIADGTDFLEDEQEGDSWFVRLLKAIGKFLKFLIIPDDIQNEDGSKTNYFEFTFNDMHQEFTNKVPVINQMGSLVNDLSSGFQSYETNRTPEIRINAGSIELMGQSYDLNLNVIDFSFMTGSARNIIHGVILLIAWLKFIIALPKKIQNLIRG